jgi:DNA mismatch endonuclease (patch repair protein)
MPKTNRDYWSTKIARNRERDERNLTLLQAQGWKTLIVWECQIGNGNMEEEVRAFLAPSENIAYSRG